MENIPGQLDGGSLAPPGPPTRKDETSALRLFDRRQEKKKKEEEERKEVIEVSLLSVMVWQLQEIEGRDRNRPWWGGRWWAGGEAAYRYVSCSAEGFKVLESH